MKLVIEIDEEIYNHMKERFMYGYADTELDKVGLAVSNGKPLPKGHGRLGDLDALQKEVSSWGMNDYEPSDFIDEINNADTIIEADKENVALKALKQEPNWIPVSERLPNFNDIVLASADSDYDELRVIITVYGGEEFWFNGKIKAWMPLPEPYKAESDDDE